MQKNRHVENWHVENGHVENGHVENGHVENGHVEEWACRKWTCRNGHVEDGHVEDVHVQKWACRKWTCRKLDMQKMDMQKMGMQKNGHVEKCACKQRLAVIKRQEQKKMDGWRWDDSWQGMDGSHSEHEYKQIFNPLNDKYMQILFKTNKILFSQLNQQPTIKTAGCHQ